jgi:hypothetical protein
MCLIIQNVTHHTSEALTSEIDEGKELVKTFSFKGVYGFANSGIAFSKNLGSPIACSMVSIRQNHDLFITIKWDNRIRDLRKCINGIPVFDEYSYHKCSEEIDGERMVRVCI